VNTSVLVAWSSRSLIHLLNNTGLPKQGFPQ
jgi:hypothetical protein